MPQATSTLRIFFGCVYGELLRKRPRQKLGNVGFGGNGHHGTIKRLGDV